MASNRYCVDIAKRGTAGCKECKQKIEKGLCRIGLVTPSPFSEGDMKQWFHISCMFKKLCRAKSATKKIENEDDLEGWDDIDDESKEEILKEIKDFWDINNAIKPKSSKKGKADPKSLASESTSVNKDSQKAQSPSPSAKKSPTNDDYFRTFRKICARVASIPEYTEKTALFADFFKNGSDKNGFQSDLYLWVKMLLQTVDKRVYNLQSKKLVKIFSQIFDAYQDEMIDDLNQGDVAETVGEFFEKSEKCPPCKKSTLTLQEVEKFLEELTSLSKEEEQTNVLRRVTKKCTANDLRMFVRLIKHDLKIVAGPKHVLEALHPTAYQAFQASNNLKEVVRKATQKGGAGNSSNALSVQASVLTPVKPMLAEVCGSMEKAFERCPNGLFIEIKYDGERVQVHKKGNEFSYFSRSLKPVMPGKVVHLKDYIPKAFPYGNDLILDSEILLVDSEGKPLPFGTLGEHKRKAFKDATVCLFVFDCLQFNDESLINKPLHYRRKVLKENLKEIKGHVMLSEMKFVDDPKDLESIMKSVISQGLEGLLIKDKNGIYEPGKRHWVKMKKDYIAKVAREAKKKTGGDVPNKGKRKEEEDEGMADTADLAVVGAYYGTGKKGGIMSVFLMGCWSETKRKWCTVTKVGGRNDRDLAKLQKTLKMKEINKDPMKVPSWLDVNKSLIPDFVAVDPMDTEVWEITGAEFTKSEVHTADGISIRFPRLVRVRDDKTPKEATKLKRLKRIYEVSKQTTEMIGLRTASDNKRKSPSEDESSPGCSKSRRSQSPEKSSTSHRFFERSASKSRSRSRSKSPARKKSKLSESPPSKKSVTKSRRSPSKSPPRKKSNKSKIKKC